MTALTGSALVQPLWRTTDKTDGAVGNGWDSTGYLADIIGTGDIDSSGWSPATTARIGSSLNSFIGDWYGRVFWWPQSIDAGALQAPETYTISVWNGNPSSITLTSITFTDADGITTDGVPTETIGGLVSRTYSITISPTGTRSEMVGTMTFTYGLFSFGVQVLAQEYGFWLSSDNATRCLLVEAQRYGSITHYLSNLAYISRSSDTPANQGYDELLLTDVEVRSRIDGEMLVGGISVDNTDGSLDDWLSYAWEGWPIRLYLGDVTWPRDAFQALTTGTIELLEAPSSDRVEFKIRDKRSMLDMPVLTGRLSDDTPIPVSLGTVFNISPLWTGTSLVFQVNDGAVTSIDSVRDRGVSCSKTDTLSAGTFSKTSAPVDRGQITADVTGATNGTAAEIVEWLGLRAGLATTDIDYSSLAAFPNTSTLGLFVNSERTCLDCLDEVMASVGGAWRFSREGKLQIFRLQEPSVTADLELTEDDVEFGEISVTAVEPPLYSVRLGYRRNWTVQDPSSLAGSVSEANRALYSQEYSIVESISATIRDEYPLAEDPEMIGTLFVSQSDAQAEADRRLTLRSSKRSTYLLTCFALPFSVQLGYTVKLTHSRYGFSSGVNALVIGMREFPALDKVEIELWH